MADCEGEAECEQVPDIDRHGKISLANKYNFFVSKLRWPRTKSAVKIRTYIIFSGSRGAGKIQIY